MLLSQARPLLRTSFTRAMSTSDSLVLTSRSPSNHVAILTLNRPKALNALSSPLFDQLNAELVKADEDDTVRAVVITGGEKVFAAGADIKEMRDKSCECCAGMPWGSTPDSGFGDGGVVTATCLVLAVSRMLMISVAEAYRKNFLGSWNMISSMRKPIIGAVSGYAVSREGAVHYDRADS